MRAPTFYANKSLSLGFTNLYICIPPIGVNVILIQTLLLVNVVYCRLLQERGCH